MICCTMSFRFSTYFASVIAVSFFLTVDLIKMVSDVRAYVRPSTKSFFDFNEIWLVGRG